jgi:beta-mannanase
MTKGHNMELKYVTELEVFNAKYEDVQIIIRYIHEGDKVELWWTDYVANDWSEIFDTLAEAFTRCALLLECMYSGWELGFAHSSREHIDHHRKFVNEGI